MIHLELQREIEARVVSGAAAQGMPLERYVESLLSNVLDEDAQLVEAMADIAAGRTRSTRDVFAELHERLRYETSCTSKKRKEAETSGPAIKWSSVYEKPVCES